MEQEKYLKDIHINIDNRIINTDKNGIAIIYKVPQGINKFTISKKGYIPITSQINIPNELEKTYTVEIVNNSFQISAQPNNAIISVTVTYLDGTQQSFQYIGNSGLVNVSFGTYIEYTITLEGYETVTGNFYCKNPNKNGTNIKAIQLEREKGTLILNLKSNNNVPLPNLTVICNNLEYVSDSNGTVTIPNLLYGLYIYNVLETEVTDSYTGIANINSREVTYDIKINSTTDIFLTDNSLIAGSNIIINTGMATSGFRYSGYDDDTSNSIIYNELSMISELQSVEGNIGFIEQDPMQTAEISIVADQNDSNIEFNNDNEINSVNINVIATDVYLAFTQNNKTIYFKNTPSPFYSYISKTYPSTTYTYYTYENGQMVEHTATTTSNISDVNSFDGTTLILETMDTFSNGTWIKDNTKNIEFDDESSEIITSSYITNPNPVIQRENYSKFAVEKLNPSQWQMPDIYVGGIKKDLIGMQEIYVTSEQLIEIYFKQTGTDKNYYKQFFITNDKIIRKFSYTINVNQENAIINFNVNGFKFQYTGSTVTLDVYAGDTINWSVSKEGYITQSGSYATPDNSKVKTETNNIILVSE